MLKRFSLCMLLLFAVAAAHAENDDAEDVTIRWGDKAAEALGGSLEFSFQKRLVRSPMEKDLCKECRHYAELRVGNADVDEIDVSHAILGYRYYARMNEDVWAAYLGVGIGRYLLDPGETSSGWNVRVGVDIAITDSCTNEKAARRRRATQPGSLRTFIMDWETNLTYHTVDRPGSDLSYLHILTGIRMVLPSKHDKERVELRQLCPRGDNLEDSQTDHEGSSKVSRAAWEY